jgi:trehalose 6-phosphate synthase/phosphatase
LWRRRPDTAWEPCAPVTSTWRRGVDSILEQFAASTPGARIERKTASVAWHYRQADAEFGARQAHELRMLLGDALSNQPLEVLEGKKVIEIRLRGVSKALVAHHTKFPGHHAVVAIGDDRTDEDLFHALPPGAVTIAVGNAPTRAAHQVADHRGVRRILLDIRTALDAALDGVIVGSQAGVE